MTPPRRLGGSAVAVSPLGLRTTPLGRQRIDVVFVHDPDDHMAAALDGALAIGAGMNSVPRPTVDDRARYNYQQAPRELLARARRLADVCCLHGTSLPQAAMQFPLAHRAVVSVLVGAEWPEQLVEDVGHVGAAISSQLWGALADEGPLPADAPTRTSLAT